MATTNGVVGPSPVRALVLHFRDQLTFDKATASSATSQEPVGARVAAGRGKARSPLLRGIAVPPLYGGGHTTDHQSLPGVTKPKEALRARC